MAERARGSRAARVRVESAAESATGSSQGATVEEAPLRPGQCRAYMRRELAREFRGIVRGFVEGAKSGSCQHVKLATELVGTRRRTRRRGKSTVKRLIEEFEARQV